MNKDLLRLIVDLIAFLALSDDETVDPDSAVEQLEHAADMLKGLPATEKGEFVAFLTEYAHDVELSGDQARSEFLANLPAQLGI